MAKKREIPRHKPKSIEAEGAQTVRPSEENLLQAPIKKTTLGVDKRVSEIISSHIKQKNKVSGVNIKLFEWVQNVLVAALNEEMTQEEKDSFENFGIDISILEEN